MSATAVKLPPLPCPQSPYPLKKQAIFTTQVKHGQQEHDQDLKTTDFSFIIALKACTQKKDLYQVGRIHAEICNSGLLQKNSYLGNTLVSTYAKCGALTKARKVLHELPVRDVVSWSALIAGYAQHGCGKEALVCFQQMLSEGISPNAITYACALKACGIVQDVEMGERIQGKIFTQGLLQKHVLLGNALVDMYAKCGALVKARTVIEELPVRNVVSWSTLIARYADHGYGKEALDCFQQMLSEGLSPNAITYACALKACSIAQDVDMGKRFHGEIATQGLLQKHVLLGGALIDMYAKCGALKRARKVLEELPVRDVVSWSALIAGYAKHGCGKEALGFFQQMLSEGLSPNAITYSCVLKACGIVQDVDMGEKIHGEIATQGLLQKHVLVGNALVDMYAKCGALMKARNVLYELPVRDVISWNALIGGYGQHGCGKEALGCFQQLLGDGLSPDAITYGCTLKACGIEQDVDMGERIHGEIVTHGLLQKHVLLGNALIDMYAKCGALAKARKVLDDFLIRDVVSWSVLIVGYSHHGCGKEALGCFQQMLSEGLSPDAITYACALKACGIAQDLDMGERIHGEIATQGLLQKHVLLGNALVDMCVKCGDLAKARKVLDELHIRDVVSWSTLIAGYAQNGYGKAALGCFGQMVSEGLSPDATTFACVLNACSHSGLVDEGQMLFDSMREKYGITPNEEHYTCMVDLFGRARHFDKAMGVIKKMPSSDCPPVWHALLGACRKWGNVELGRLAFECAVELDKSDAAAYVLMSNIFAAAGMHEEAQNMECRRISNGAYKQPGRSCWTDASGKVHKFVVGDTRHPQSKEIQLELQDLEHLLFLQGYSPDLHWVSQNIPPESKKVLLCQHSEKLAIACAIINTPEGTDIRITKNLRVCGDCHAASSLISKIKRRKILVKDANRVHIFEGGKCSCGDYL